MEVFDRCTQKPVAIFIWCGVDVTHKSLISIVVESGCNLLVLIWMYPIHPDPSQHMDFGDWSATKQALRWFWMSPPGHLRMALKELFVEASAADSVGGMLNPDELLRSVRLHASKYEAYKMHDSYELLESLRNALQDEETGI